MPMKRKARKWQDYTQRYDFARRKSQPQDAPDARRYSISDTLLFKKYEAAAVCYVTILPYRAPASPCDDVIGDIQSELPAVRSTAVDQISTFHQGAILGVYAKTASMKAKQAWMASASWMPQRPGEIWERHLGLPRAATLEDTGKQEPVGDWVQSPEAILQRLTDPSLTLEERRLTVLFAETVAFDDAQRSELLSGLHRYILDDRFNRDEDAQTSVGSAIRKFAMNMDESRFEQYAEFFAPSETETLSCELELELAKAVTWRMVYEPLDSNLSFPTLQAKLTELAKDYLTPRLVLQKNYATVALNAVLAARLLGADKSLDLVAQIHALKLDWFTALFVRRLRKTHAELKSRGSALAERLAMFLPTHH